MKIFKMAVLAGFLGFFSLEVYAEKQDQAVQTASAEQPVETPAIPENSDARQFGSLVSKAQQALPVFLQGDFSTQESIANKGRAYMTLCQLAEQFDFTHQPGLAPTLQSQVQSAQQLVSELFSNAKSRNDLASIASRWWSHPGRSNHGIIFSGEVQKVHRDEEP